MAAKTNVEQSQKTLRWKKTETEVLPDAKNREEGPQREVWRRSDGPPLKEHGSNIERTPDGRDKNNTQTKQRSSTALTQLTPPDL